MSLLRRVAAASLVALFAPASACMGSFALTRGLYGWNERITDNKIVNNLVFWALGILPVYSLVMTGDLLILNVIEFWTGKSLLATNAPDSNDVVTRVDGSIVLEHAGHMFVATPVDAQRVVVSADGRALGELALQDDGTLRVIRADGDVTTLTAAEMDAIVPAIASLAR